MFEFLALIGLIVIGILVFKLVFGMLGLVFHILLWPLKLALGLVVMVVALPFLILFLPVFLVLGLGFAIVGTIMAALWGLCWAL